LAHGNTNFTMLFCPSLVTTRSATLMAVRMVDDHLAQGRARRPKRG
jgi:hypothetical protein